MTNEPTQPKILVGDGDFVYQALDHWHSLPGGVDLVEAVGVATDSQDRVFVFNRGRQAINVFDRDGSHLFGWQAGIFTRPHGITIGPDDFLFNSFHIVSLLIKIFPFASSIAVNLPLLMDM